MRLYEDTTFFQIVHDAPNQTGLCILLFLAVVMTADEEENSSEKELLSRIAESSKVGSARLDVILDIARSRDVGSIAFAGALMRQGIDSEGRIRLLELFIGMMVADGYVSIPEQHIVRFLSDLFSVGTDLLSDVYHRVVGSEMPRLGDPSSPEWWARKERKYRDRPRSDNNIDARTRRAYALLGLEHTATDEEVRNAYRRLAKVHHPDRYQQVGQEAVDAATERFQDINAAYEHLAP